MDYDTPIWRRIQELLGRKGMTLQDLADRSRVSRRHIYNIGCGDREPSVPVLQALSRPLGVSAADLIYHTYGVVALKSAHDAAVDQVASDEQQPPRLSTGYERVDALTSKLRRGQLVLLCGNAGLGKTALALQWVETTARERPGGTTPIVFTEVEDGDRRAPLLRMVLMARKEGESYRMVDLTDFPHREILRRVEYFPDCDFLLDCPNPITKTEIVGQLRWLTRHMQISLVVIDPIDSMLRRATLPHLLAWLKEKANAFDCLIVAAVDDERGELEEAGAMGSSGSVSSCFESVDLVLRFHAPSQSGQSNDNRRVVADDGSGVGSFTDLSLCAKRGILRE